MCGQFFNTRGRGFFNCGPHFSTHCAASFSTHGGGVFFNSRRGRFFTRLRGQKRIASNAVAKPTLQTHIKVHKHKKNGRIQPCFTLLARLPDICLGTLRGGGLPVAVACPAAGRPGKGRRGDAHVQPGCTPSGARSVDARILPSRRDQDALLLPLPPPPPPPPPPPTPVNRQLVRSGAKFRAISSN